MSAFRLLPVVARALLAPASPALGESVLHMRVLPTDLDTNLHMNNGRYLSMMDLGRFDLVIRAGLHRPLVRRRWTPLVGSATIRFRRSLRPFQRYQLHTRVLCWDDKWFVFEQRFESEGGLCALALVRALFRGRDGNVPPQRGPPRRRYRDTIPALPRLRSRLGAIRRRGHRRRAGTCPGLHARLTPPRRLVVLKLPRGSSPAP